MMNGQSAVNQAVSLLVPCWGLGRRPQRRVLNDTTAKTSSVILRQTVSTLESSGKSTNRIANSSPPRLAIVGGTTASMSPWMIKVGTKTALTWDQIEQLSPRPWCSGDRYHYRSRCATAVMLQYFISNLAHIWSCILPIGLSVTVQCTDSSP
jgi:hypothetical protein